MKFINNFQKFLSEDFEAIVFVNCIGDNDEVTPVFPATDEDGNSYPEFHTPEIFINGAIPEKGDIIGLTDMFKAFGGCDPKITDQALVTEISYFFDWFGKIRQIQLCLDALPETEKED